MKYGKHPYFFSRQDDDREKWEEEVRQLLKSRPKPKLSRVLTAKAA